MGGPEVGVFLPLAGDVVTVVGSFQETSLIVETGLTGGYVPARV
jgi:hypothetical protein